MGLRSNLRTRLQRLIMIGALGMSLMLIGCASTVKSPPYVGNLNPIEVGLDVNEPALFAGVLMEFGRYEYLLRCENYVVQRGINP